MSIKVLSDQLASQIAAGEVVERPSSVVKELVENAIDAGASNINVDVRGGGRELIQVADDGEGIAASQVDLAFQRHATSKLVRVSDLNAIATLGFRGEALAAIAAVSRLVVVTRSESEASGSRLVLTGGQQESVDRVGAPHGTVIAVEDLFFNVPARLKFLKSQATEKRLIDEFVTRYAQAYPGIRFRLSHNGRITFQTSGNGDLREVMTAVHGPETARELLEVQDENRPGVVQVTGFVAPPSRHWANRTHITLFVNGRWIRDSRLTYAVIQAYHTLLPTGRYPLAIIFLDVPPERIDVNVHPAKTEVRFRDGGALFSAVQRAVRETLIADSPVRNISHFASPTTPGWGGTFDQHAITRQEDWPEPQLGLDWSRLGSSPYPDEGNGQPLRTQEPHLPAGDQPLPILRVVGQVGAAYIVAEGPDGLFLIDQHAAHERILYEQFMATQEEEGVVSQGLVTGTAVHLTPPQATLLEDNLTLLADLGFQIEPFGPHSFMIRAVPTITIRRDPGQVLVDVVEDLERGDAPLQGEIEARIVRRVCKTAAVKAGQSLARPEMEAMIRQLEACHNPHTCPHGRPTLIHLSVAQLAKEFGRI